MANSKFAKVRPILTGAVWQQRFGKHAASGEKERDRNSGSILALGSKSTTNRT